MKAQVSRNLIGSQIRRKRCEKDWSQEYLCSRLHDLGWNICRTRIARIEAGEACVKDIEYLLFAKAFGTKMDDLLPRIDGSHTVFYFLMQLTGGQLKKLVSPEDILAEESAKLLNGKENGKEILSSFLDNSNGDSK